MGRPLPWSPAELKWLRENYQQFGRAGCAERMGRTRSAVGVMASRLNLRTAVTNRARRPSLAGDELEEAIRLHEEEGWGFEQIGRKFGYCRSEEHTSELQSLMRSSSAVFCLKKNNRTTA